MLRQFRTISPCTKAWRFSPALSSNQFACLHSSTGPEANYVETAKPDPSNDDSDLTKSSNGASDLSVPWYLREDITSLLVESKQITLPEIPSHAPPQVEEFLSLLAKDYGLDNLMLFDMTELPEEHDFKENNKNIDYIIIATGKSEKHIYKAANELRIHLKHTYNSVPAIEGMVSSAITPSMRRRLIRRARKGPLATDNEYGKSANSWVICHHEGIDIHMLTGPRREELNLESLWCKPEDAEKFSTEIYNSQESDHIFSGIRRFHTSARSYSTASSELSSYYSKLLNQSLEMSTSDLQKLRQSFDQCFLHLLVKDYDVKFQFLRALHLTRPDLVSLSEVKDALLAKYVTQESLREDLSQRKVDDITEYAKLLIDSPALDTNPGKSRADAALDSLSGFISALYTFSNDTLLLSANPQLVPLLWRLTYSETRSTVVYPRDIDNFIQHGTYKSTHPGPVITLAGNTSRSILHLIDYFKRREPGSVPTAAFRELILLTYGNAGKWDKFWGEWEKLCFERHFEPAEAVEKWTRICVYLSMRGNKAESLRFLQTYWSNSDSVCGSVLASLRANNGQFNLNDERVAFKKAMARILGSLETPDKVPFEGVKIYVDLL